MTKNCLKESLPSGRLEYTLTNDYMFKTYLQRSEIALKSLLCALLQIDSATIKSIVILNPIDEGKAINNKMLILDIKILLNDNEIINIEMQVADLGNWEERSLTYLCRAFDQLNAGEDYLEAKKTIQIGILDFTPDNFPAEFFMDYIMYNEKTHHVYSDKLHIIMLQLNQLGNPKDEELMPELYHWAQLLKATTWEEIGILAEKDEAINETLVTLKSLSADEDIRMQCEARERYHKDMNSIKQQGFNYGVKQGIEQGIKQGIEQGIEQGSEQMAKLTKILLDNHQQDLLMTALEDEKVRQELFKKYDIYSKPKSE